MLISSEYFPYHPKEWNIILYFREVPETPDAVPYLYQNFHNAFILCFIWSLGIKGRSFFNWNNLNGKIKMKKSHFWYRGWGRHKKENCSEMNCKDMVMCRLSVLYEYETCVTFSMKLFFGYLISLSSVLQFKQSPVT